MDVGGDGNGDESKKGSGGDPTSLEDIMIDIDAAANLLFPDEAFPSLPDFPPLPSPPPCLDHLANSSRSDPLSPSSSSSSSSWTFLSAPVGNEADVGNAHPDFLDSLLQVDDSELWDPNSLFLEENGENNNSTAPLLPSVDEDGKEEVEDGGVAELGEVFLEWLRNNRDAISPEDLRNIRLKKSTIECAAARLGEGRQGKMKLVKLILAWVQNSHLQKRRRQQHQQPPAQQQRIRGGRQQNDHDDASPNSAPALSMISVPSVDLGNATASPNPSPGLECNFDEFGVHKYSTWMQYPAIDPMMMSNGIGGDQLASFYDPNGGGSGSIGFNGQPFSIPPPYPLLIPPTQMGCYPPPCPQLMQMLRPPPGGFVYQAPSLGRMSSATKEARKKRMARQRRYSTLHQNRSNSHQPYGHQPHAAASPGGGGGSSSTSSHASPRNWTSLAALSPSPSPPVVKPATADAPPPNATNMQQKRNAAASSDKRQSSKLDKNLRFLLQKVLKQSDVGSLGRIVLPKKEAEIHLPELNARDGISIPMEDIGTSRIWNMRYRFWPNNKSRMYLLENTGDFVRANGLQEGDFIVIYFDVKCNKYMIRGVKVRTPPEKKASAGADKSTGKALKPKKTGRSNSSINSLVRATSSCERSEDDMMEELLADHGEGHQEMASSPIIKFDDA